MEVWREIRSFPGYLVGDEGHVKNEETGRYMTQLRNQHGVVHVGLTRDRVQYRRSVAVLVANAFVDRLPGREHFDTPINLDGDRSNNRVPNIMWRPRWFAVKYFNQFDNPYKGFTGPIEDTLTGEKFDSSWEAATKYGLLEKDIYLSILNRTYVVPTFQTFRTLD